MFEDESKATFIALTAASVLKYALSAWAARNSHKTTEYVPVGRVGQLWIYPIKSVKGIQVQSAECTRSGLRQKGLSDRSLIVTNKDGKPMSFGTSARFALISSSFEDGVLCIDAPGMATLRVPVDLEINSSRITTIGCEGDKYYLEVIDCGDKAGAWFDKFFSKEGMRLNLSLKDMPKRDASNIQRLWTHQAQPGDTMTFANFCGYMLLGKSSIEELNSHLPTDPVTQKNFRPSIVVDGSTAFDEDLWEEVKIGEVTFRKIDACSRCFVVNINPETGKVDKNSEPLSTMKTYRNRPGFTDKPCMGIYLAIDSNQEETIKVGDQILAKKRL